MQNGIKIQYNYKDQLRVGYLMFMGTTAKHEAKFAFVGTNHAGFITTIHTQSGKNIWRTINKDIYDKSIRGIQ